MRHLISSIFISALFILSNCNPYADIDFRQEMRKLVIHISMQARSEDPDFIIIPQNGIDIISSSEETLTLYQPYMDAIDAVGQEDLYYGYDMDNTLTPTSVQDYLLPFLYACVSNSVKVLVTDYCQDVVKMSNSYSWNTDQGFLSFAADHRGLDNIPSYPLQPYRAHAGDVSNIMQASNFLYVLDSAAYSTKASYIEALSNNNYDVIIMDLYYQEELLSSNDTKCLQLKSNGGKRLLIAYMSIGEAEDYRPYWNSDWSTSPPEWIIAENPDWAGNYKVRYWETQWQDILFRGNTSYLELILAAGFDGVYLDIIDAFEYFEDL